MSAPRQTTAGALPTLRPDRWYYRFYLGVAEALARYHRLRVEGTPPAGPCIYVALHGAGYFVLDLVIAGYALAWRDFFRNAGERIPLRIVAAESKIEKALPGLPTVKRHFGIIDTSEASCLAALEAGEQLLVTPGGMREAQPARDFYRLKWDGRYGFVRLALKTGAPIVPLAVVGGAEAYPGVRAGKLSFWSPVPLPARFELALGEPIPVARAPERARDLEAVRPIQEEAWRRTQALYDRLRAERTRT
jgi:1-acyl-sn-glycerol-3-phosphate acyltransferase